MKKVRRISSILLINAFFLAILPILIFGVVSVFIVSGHMEREIGSKNNLLARSIRLNMALYLETAFNELNHLAENAERQLKSDTVNFQLFLDSERTKSGVFEILYVIDEKGVARAVSPYDEDYAGTSAAGQEYFVSPSGEGGRSVSKIFISPKSGGRTIALSYKGKKYISAGYLDLLVMRRVVEFGDISPRGYVLVVDPDGTIITHRNFPAVEEQMNIGRLGFVESAIEKPDENFKYDFGGERWIVSAVIHPETGWIISVVQPFSEAFQSLYQIILILAAFISSAAAFALLSAISNRRRIQHPLGKLVEMSRNIAQGRYINSYDSSSVEELNNLFRVLIIMSEEIALREKLLEQSREEYSELVNNVNSIIIKWNNKGEYTFLNRYAQEYLGFTEEELLGKSLVANTIPDTESGGRSLVNLPRDIIEHPEQYTNNENEVVKKNGERVWVHWSNSPLYDDRGRVAEILSVGTDRTLNRRIEEELAKSLREKEILIREIHHRVKNNMQIISSLLNLQAGSLRDEAAAELFQESQNRVYSMALVHELLYQSEFLSSIRFEDYIRDLVQYLRDSFNLSSGEVDFSIEVEDIFLTIDTAVPCALIINELVSNAIKHAFVGLRGGTIRISMAEKDGEYTVIIVDNGRGFPGALAYGADDQIPDLETMGLKLVYGLSQQLRGKVSITPSPGTTVTVTFPVPAG